MLRTFCKCSWPILGAASMEFTIVSTIKLDFDDASE
jgi:hypothetical protein